MGCSKDAYKCYEQGSTNIYINIVYVEKCCIRSVLWHPLALHVQQFEKMRSTGCYALEEARASLVGSCRDRAEPSDGWELDMIIMRRKSLIQNRF